MMAPLTWRQVLWRTRGLTRCDQPFIVCIKAEILMVAKLE
jgi:hypothetical protein